MKKFLVISLLATVSGFALAHSSLESSSPEDGAVLSEAPTEVVLEFKETIEADFSLFKVYAIPADMLADAEMSGGTSEHSEGEEHSEGDSHSETQASESGETHSTEGEHSETEGEHSAEGEHSEGEDNEAHSDEGEHNEGGAHGVMDAAASMFVPTVIDLTGDEEARADSAVTAEGTTNNVSITLKDNLAPGAYVVMFRVLSSDTHTVEGFITFEIEE
jgi:methionine-rich copper-binding protein CopC